jgi:hypothetical protein
METRWNRHKFLGKTNPKGEWIQMRLLLAVTVLGASLAFTASAALAEGNVDPKSVQFLLQSETVASPAGMIQGSLSGPGTPDRVYVVSDQNGKK